ncbi:MAG: DnaA regulatory inactivator Hda [Gammaproteobacteria bacterium]
MAQLPLPLAVGRHYRFENFVVGRNAEAVTRLQSLSTDRDPATIWLSGPGGSGKTHLLQAATACATDGAMYVPLRIAGSSGPQVLEGLDALALLALDDVDAVAGHDDWERALFDLFNRTQSAGGRLIFAARNPPAHGGFSLPDLASRVASAVVYRLTSLDDEESLEALQRHARSRGLELPEPAARYLLTRITRDMAAICRWLDELDAASLAAQRKLTVPFIRDALAERT